MTGIGNISDYCFGPVTLVGVQKSDDDLTLTVEESLGKLSRVTYHDCIYGQFTKDTEGQRIYIAEQKTADELIKLKDSNFLAKLNRNHLDVESLIWYWESEKKKFFIHYTEDEEHLIVASNIEYRNL